MEDERQKQTDQAKEKLDSQRRALADKLEKTEDPR